ncbi:unnamed protein product, partial [Heterosigma akashiwo]
ARQGLPNLRNQWSVRLPEEARCNPRTQVWRQGWRRWGAVRSINLRGPCPSPLHRQP